MPLSAKADKLKDWLLLMNTKRSQFMKTPICNPDSLRSLIPEERWGIIDAKSSVFDQVVEILRHTVLDTFITNIHSGNDREAQAALLLWFSYLDPSRIGSLQKKSVHDAVLTCTEDVIGWFLDETIRVFMEDYLYKDNLVGQTAFFDRIDSDDWFSKLMMAPQPKLVGKKAIIVLDESSRRNYTNYLNKLIEKLANAIENAAPGIFTGISEPVEERIPQQQAKTVELITPDEPPWRTVINAYVEQVISSTSTLPEAFGYSPASSRFIPRKLQVSSRVSDAIAPMIMAELPANTSRMSGILVGEAGSGRTAHLGVLLRQLAELQKKGQTQVLPMFVRAAEFLPYADAQRSIYEYAARKILGGAVGQVIDLADYLKKCDIDRQLFWLIDDLDHISGGDQAKILKHFAFCSNLLVSALPRQTEIIQQHVCAPNLGREHFGNYALVDLATDVQERFLSVFVGDDPQFDMVLGRLALSENPTLAHLPLGIAAICRNVTAHTSNPAYVGISFLNEMFERDGLNVQFPLDTPEKPDNPTVWALLRMINCMYGRTPSSTFIHEMTGLSPLSREIDLGPGGAALWQMLPSSRLFQISPDGQSARCSSRTLVYLAAYSTFHGWMNLQSTKQPITQDIKGLHDALWEWNMLTRMGG